MKTPGVERVASSVVLSVDRSALNGAFDLRSYLIHAPQRRPLPDLKVDTMPKVAHHAFPGGYPMFYYVKSDDGELHSCPSCVNRNRTGKNVTARQGYINYEDDTLTCDVCENKIESAYGE